MLIQVNSELQIFNVQNVQLIVQFVKMLPSVYNAIQQSIYPKIPTFVSMIAQMKLVFFYFTNNFHKYKLIIKRKKNK